MTAPENERPPSAAQRGREIRNSTIVWSVIIAAVFLLAAWNWGILLFDAGGTFGTWALAIVLTVVAAGGVVFLVSARRLVRRLSAQHHVDGDHRN